jgi:signal transduction histidine kinase
MRTRLPRRTTAPDTGLSSGLRLTVAGWILGLLVTVWILWGPYLVFGYRSPAAHLVLDTVDSCVALLAAYLAYGRFVRGHRLQDLLLTLSLVVLSLTGFAATYAVTLVDAPAGTLEIWLPLSLRFTGSLLLVAAAVVGPRRPSPTADGHWTVTLPLALVVLMSGAFWAAGPRLPVAVDELFISAAVQPPILTAHPVLIGAQIVSAGCFLVASFAFARQGLQRDDALLRWLGPACALGAFARLNYALSPSLYTDWIYTGDVLRTGFYLLLLVGAAQELGQYWHAQAASAVLEDRRRLARELHDGVVQELAYIRTESHSLPATSVRERIVGACDRGLDEARAAVNALGRTGHEPLAATVHRAALELAHRHRVDLAVDLDDTVQAGSDARHALLRITREAFTNAVRHGRAGRVCVRLRREGEHRVLTIHDDGVGFDVSRALAHASGYGLVSMRERAGALPGRLDIESQDGSGSVVRVTW